VGTKAEVHQLLHQMAQMGIAIIAISSELPEVMAISDRILVFRSGRLVGTLAREEASEERLMQLMVLGAGAAKAA
jgi:inositol transport system ATP-binding protein